MHVTSSIFSIAWTYKLSYTYWQDSDLITKLLEIFEILKNFLVILFSIKNDVYKRIVDV